MKIAVGSDHAGYEDPPPHYKPELMAHLGIKGFDVVNCGTDTPESVDYPDVAETVCEKVLSGETELGLLVCGSGVGMSITANRHKGIRAAVCTTPEMARLSRQHNHANVLCLASDVMGQELIRRIVAGWLDTEFEGGGRHERRVRKVAWIERGLDPNEYDEHDGLTDNDAEE